MALPAVAFYVIEAAGAAARLKVACRIIEKAWNAGNTVIVLQQDAAALRSLDELLWSCDEHSFIPHEVAAPGMPAPEAPVILSSAAAPPGPFDLLINLTDRLPEDLSQVIRVAEIIDAQAPCRAAGRARFKAYRELGIAPATHNIRA